MLLNIGKIKFIKKAVGAFADEDQYSISLLGLEEKIVGWHGVPLASDPEIEKVWWLVDIFSRELSLKLMAEDILNIRKNFSSRIVINNNPSLQKEIGLSKRGVEFNPSNEIVTTKGLLRDKSLKINPDISEKFSEKLNSYSIENQNTEINSFMIVVSQNRTRSAYSKVCQQQERPQIPC